MSPTADTRPGARLLHIHHTLRTGRSTPALRAAWTGELAKLVVPAQQHRRSEARFAELCEHLATHAETADLQQRLIRALSRSLEHLEWHSALLPEIDHVLALLIDELLERLTAELAENPGPDETREIYEKLRDHCWGCDERIIDLFAANPHVSGRRIILDFAYTVADSAHPGILRRLEDEDETELLIEVLENKPDCGENILGALRDPDRLADNAITRHLNQEKALPEWAWSSDILLTRFHLVRSRIPWTETAHKAGPELRRRIHTHLRGALDGNPESWENFRALADGFHGTLDDLVETARIL